MTSSKGKVAGHVGVVVVGVLVAPRVVGAAAVAGATGKGWAREKGRWDVGSKRSSEAEVG